MNEGYNTIVNLLGVTFWLDNANNIVGLVIGVLTLVGIIINLFSIIKKAKADGKIDDKEKQEIVDALKDGKETIKDITETIKDIKEDKQDE